jgi:hypothetical protein
MFILRKHKLIFLGVELTSLKKKKKKTKKCVVVFEKRRHFSERLANIAEDSECILRR